MAENNATILIPDISGFTAFMTSTELSHASHAIHMLIDAILKAVGDEYEVSEIEGDCVLLIKKGPPPAKKEILQTCLNIFNAFHFQRKFMQQYTICPCGACQAIIDLTLKFVVHHGPLAEIKVGKFVKQSGTEMIVAHRLLKNSIASNEYLLLTEKLWQNATGSTETVPMDWRNASDEYPSLGKVDYRFVLLSDAKRNVPDPPVPETWYRTDNSSHLELPIAADFMDVYMQIMNIPDRPAWMKSLLKVEQVHPDVFIGSIHQCAFDDYEAIISPLKMTFSQEGILYAERCTIKEIDLSVVHEFVFRKTGEHSSIFATRFLNAGESPIPAEWNAMLFDKMKDMAHKLKEHCEKSFSY